MINRSICLLTTNTMIKHTSERLHTQTNKQITLPYVSKKKKTK